MTEDAASVDTPPEEPSPPAESLSIGENFRILFGASKSFWLVNQVNFFDGIAYFGILSLLTLFIGGDLGFSEKWTGYAVSLFTGAVTLFMVWGGFVSDHLGVRRSITLCLLVLLGGRILLSVSPVFGAMGSGLAMWGALLIMALATAVLQPTLYAGIKEFTDPRTATIGYSLLYSIMNMGIVAGEFASPFIRDAARGDTNASGITGVFWALSGVTGFMLLVHVLLFTKTTEQRDRVLEYEKSEPKKENQSTLEKVKNLPIMDTRFLFFIFILLPVRTLFAHQWLTLPDYVTRCFPESISHRYEWFQGINPLIIVIFVPLIAAMTRKANIINMMIVGTTVSAVITFILVPGPNVTTLIIYLVVFSLGEAMWSSRFLEYVADLAPAGKVGAYMGLAGIPWFLAKMTTGLYSGEMIAAFIPKGGPHDSGTMWLIYGLIACLSPVGLIVGRGWMNRKLAASPA